VFTDVVDSGRLKRTLIKAVWCYPVITLGVLTLAYFLGAFDEESRGPIAQENLIDFLYLFVSITPLLFIAGFLLLGRLNDHNLNNAALARDKFSTPDPFVLPREIIYGYKLASITQRPPTLTGLTGDPYSHDAHAKCGLHPDHVPPVADCECGFHAYQSLTDAQFELRLNPRTYLIEVDLYGIVLVYKRGFRAEAQVVRKLRVPTRCMNCRIFPARTFVPKTTLARDFSTGWQWRVYCDLCSSRVPVEDRLSITQMLEALALSPSST